MEAEASNPLVLLAVRRPDEDRRQSERRMIDQESVITRLARIEEHLVNIDRRLSEKIVCCRHVTSEGRCDFFELVVEHDRTINKWEPQIEKVEALDTTIKEWSGGLRAIHLLYAFISALLAVVVSRVWK